MEGCGRYMIRTCHGDWYERSDVTGAWPARVARNGGANDVDLKIFGYLEKTYIEFCSSYCHSN